MKSPLLPRWRHRDDISTTTALTDAGNLAGGMEVSATAEVTTADGISLTTTGPGIEAAVSVTDSGRLRRKV
ncbi:MAG: hypothetical protein R2932_39970 [Caldilineaceae bacterium]